MPSDLTERGVALLGFSLGGAVVLKYLGEAGAATPVVAAATVCAPLDLAKVSEELQRPRNLAYQAYMLAHMKYEATAAGARLTDTERQAILSSRSVLELEDRFIAPRLGLAGVGQHHELNSPLRFLRGIEVPTLCIAAADDPYIPTEPYMRARSLASRAVRIVIAEGGGHVGFHDADDPTCWHDRTITTFFDRIS
jgi:predicted alpha/beta-fold hydrolase